MAKRRGHGEGHIGFHKPSGKWRAAVDLGIVGNKRKRKYVYGDTRKEVATALREMHQEQAEGQIVTERQTVAQWLDRWLETYVVPRRRPKTVESYRQIVDLYLVPNLGKIQLAKLSGEHVETMVNAVLKALSPRTAQYARAVLRKSLNQAKKLGYVRRNVVLDTEAVTVEKYSPIVLGPEQSIRLLHTASGSRLEAFWYVALGCGPREGEALALSWDRVDFAHHTLTITHTLQRQKQPEGPSKLVLAPPKTARSVRIVPMPLFVEQALLRHWEQQQQEIQRAGASWLSMGLVFCTPYGTPIDARNLLREFKALLERAGLPDMRLHDLRHSCATLLIAKGVHPRVVMDVLGHSQISITMNTYGHVTAEAQRSAAQAMDGLFLEAPRDENSD
jgi:integrase